MKLGGWGRKQAGTYLCSFLEREASLSSWPAKPT
ncbi:hypothetical protein ABIB99_005894 [Bradyrhizobium sp. LA6.1]